MSDFDEMLNSAIEKGKQQGKKSSQAAADQKMTQEEIKRLHSKYRLHSFRRS